LGIFPATFPSRDRVDWLPVDKRSKILIEILVSSGRPSESGGKSVQGSQVYHVVNPHTTSWSTSLSEIIQSSYPPGIPIRSVSFNEWVRRLSDTLEDMDVTSSTNITRNPAARLINFYVDATVASGEPRELSSERAEKASKTLREIKAVNRDWIANWMKQWGIHRV
jgi:hypothetical protein